MGGGCRVCKSVYIMRHSLENEHMVRPSFTVNFMKGLAQLGESTRNYNWHKYVLYAAVLPSAKCAYVSEEIAKGILRLCLCLEKTRAVHSTRKQHVHSTRLFYFQFERLG